VRLSVKTPIRSADQELLDSFLVSAIATLLLIRIFLEATGYPQLGGDGLHIAHVLWGGLGMLVAIVLLLLFLTSTTRHVAAVVGGIGFGAFIDELGKFLTSDNNYFFRPTAALVYVVFVVLFLASHEIRNFRRLTPVENLVNAIELSKKLAVAGLGEAERDRGLLLLDGADQTNPLVPVLRERFVAAKPGHVGPSQLGRARSSMGKGYAALVGNRWFRRLIAAIFVIQAVGLLIGVTAAAAVIAGTLLGIAEARVALDEAAAGATLASWIQVTAGLAAGTLVIRGVFALWRSRVRAYRAFELAILIDLLLYLPFAFLDEGFVTFIDVLVDLALLATLRYMQIQERRMLATPSGS
jgi:hypothetical protein